MGHEIGQAVAAGDTLLSLPRPLAKSSPRTLVLCKLSIIISALIISLPCLVSGIPGDGDSITHIQYQEHFSEQFWAGDLYPRWLMNSNKGYGSPIFIVQYPLPYWVTALIRPIVRFRPDGVRSARELGVFCFLALAAAGLAAQSWLMKRFSPLAATAAGIVYIALPYNAAFLLYKSSAIGQLSAAIFMPMTLSASESLRLTLRSMSILAVMLALLVMSNLITAILFFPLMVAYAIAVRDPSVLVLRKCFLAIALSSFIGFCVSAVYLVPLFVHHSMFDASAWAFLIPSYFAFVREGSIGVHLIAAALGCSFIFTGIASYRIWATGNVLATRSLMLVPLAAGAAMAIPGFGLSLIRASGLQAAILENAARVYHQEKMLAIALSMLALAIVATCSVPSSMLGWRERTLAVAAATSFLLMTPWTAFLWSALPALAQAIQFPHRLGAILAVATLGLLATAFDSYTRVTLKRDEFRHLTTLTVVSLGVIISGFLTWRADWRWRYGLHDRATNVYNETQDLDWMFRTYVSPDRLPNAARLLGVSADFNDLEMTQPSHGQPEFIQGQGSATIISRDPRRVVISYVTSGTGVIRLAQLYSPLWNGTLLDQRSNVVSLRSSDEGLIEASLVPGDHYLDLSFVVGWSERWGAIITIVSVFLIGGGFVCDRLKSWSHTRR